MTQIQTRLDNIRQQKISGDNVYQFLLYFDLLYDKFTDSEKKEFLQSFVERVELFPEKQPDGRFLKRIKFRFPVYFDGAEVDGMRWDNETTVETVALLGRKQVSDYLHIAVNTEDLETDVGRIYTDEDIKQYIEEKYGFKVHSAYIGQVREKLGIREHENYNISHTSPRKPTICPEEKEAAIMDALKHFGLIE